MKYGEGQGGFLQEFFSCSGTLRHAKGSLSEDALIWDLAECIHA